jgi:hypothetical protein
MVAFPRTTSREEGRALLEGRGPLGGERLVDYNLFTTEAFANPNVSTELVEGSGIPEQRIDGFLNDDSYRQSRHLSRRALDPTATLAELALGEDDLRESSLARQLAEKPERIATIRLVRRQRPEELAKLNPTEPRVPWINLIPPNTKFFLEQVQESREEKVQIIDTFGQWIAFFFGHRPEVYNYAGTLLNARNHDWTNEFQENYEHFLRGTQAVKNRATIILQYDDVMVEGYMLNCVIQRSSNTDKAVPFSFNMLVANRSPLNPRRMLELRFRRSGGSAAEQELFNSMQEALDLTQAGRIDELETFLIIREQFSGNYMPLAGLATHRPATGNVESSATVQPGQVGGVVNEKPQSQPFTGSMTRKYPKGFFGVVQ